MMEQSLTDSVKEEKTNNENCEKKRRNNSNFNIKLGAIIGYLTIAINIVFGFFFTPWVISQLGTSDYGIYTLANSIINLFLIDFGLGTTANVYLARYKADGNDEKSTKFLGLLAKIYLVLDLINFVIFLSAFFLIDVVYVNLTLAERETLKPVFLIVASFALISFPSTIFNGVIKANEKFVFIKIVELLVRVFYVLFSVLSILLGWGLYGLVISNSLAGLGGTLAKFLYIHFRLKVRFNFKTSFDKPFLKEILSFSVFSCVNSLASRLIISIMPSILGVTSNSEEIAKFGIVSTMESYIYTFGTMFTGFFLPKVSRKKKQFAESPNYLTAYASHIGRLIFVFVGLIFVGYVSCGLPFMDIWVGDEFDKGALVILYISIILVCLYQLLHVPANVLHSCIYTEKSGMKYLAIIQVVAGFCNVVLGFVLSYFFGMLGAAISISICQLGRVIAEYVIFHRRLRIHVFDYVKNTYLRFLPGIALTLITGLTISLTLPLESIYVFLIAGFSSAIVFLGSSLFIGLSKEERTMIFDPFLKFFRKIKNKGQVRWNKGRPNE